MADKTATFGIRIPVVSDAELAASSVDELRKKIQSLQEAVKNYGVTLRNLRGSSDEVKAAKTKLKAALDAERNSISAVTLALGKQGATITAISAKRKSSAKEMGEGFAVAGGPVNELSEKFGGLFKSLEGVKSMSGLAAIGMAALVVVFVKLSEAAISATESVAKFLIESANMLRSQSLLREAASGNAENAKAFGDQIEALRGKVPKTREELNALSVELSKSLIQTRISGQGIVDTFNAVAQASSAMGDTAGKAIEDVITRGKRMGRMGLGRNELLGTGIQFTDVATQLAKDLHIGVGEAQRQLAQFRVGIDTGAKAVREVVERRFGELNMRKRLDIDQISKTFHDNLAGLTKNFDVTPLLEGLNKAAKFFDVTTVSGHALKTLLEGFGAILTKVFKASMPFIEAFFTQIIIESLKLEIAFLKLGIWIKKTFDVDLGGSLGAAEAGIFAAKAAFILFTSAIFAAAVPIALLVGVFAVLGAAVYGAVEAVKAFGKWFSATDFIGFGKSIIDGLVKGFESGVATLEKSVVGVATSIKEKFKNALGIHSPSTVGEGFGANFDVGIARGIDKNAQKPADATGRMANTTVTPITRGGAMSGATTNVAAGGGNALTIHAHFPNAKDGKEVAATLTSSSFKAQMLSLLEEMSRGAGIPTQTPAGS